MNRYFKLYIAATFVLFIGAISYVLPIIFSAPIVQSASTQTPLANTNSDSEVYVIQDEAANVIVKTCQGSWLYIDSIGKRIELGNEKLDTWDIRSKPSILEETVDNKNTVLLGHNYCEDGDCYKPTTDFGEIITVQKGEYASACIQGNFYQGQILVSRSMDETSTFILDDWLNAPTITAFTCYGECADTNCDHVLQRWVIAFKKF